MNTSRSFLSKQAGDREQFYSMVMSLRELNDQLDSCKSSRHFVTSVGRTGQFVKAPLMKCGHYCIMNTERCCICLANREPKSCYGSSLRFECDCSGLKSRYSWFGSKTSCRYSIPLSSKVEVPALIEWTPQTHKSFCPYIQDVANSIMSIKSVPQDILYIITHLYIQRLIKKVLVTFRDADLCEIWNNFDNPRYNQITV